MMLPNGDQAVVDPRKLTDYCLSSTHPVGRHKAAVFRAALGWTVADAVLLRAMLLDAARTVEAKMGKADEFGQRYETDFEAITPAGRAVVRAAWIVRTGEDFPRLSTCYLM
jgi:hypothetical protein